MLEVPVSGFCAESVEGVDGVVVLVDDALQAPGVVALMLVELEDEVLDGALAEPFTFTSVELDELDGADALPFTLMSVERDEVLGVEPLMVVEDELAPGTTAMPGVTSVVVVLLACAIGTLGTQPAGVVFAVSVHLGSSRVVLVIVSARAVPKAASIEAARRLRVKVVRFISLLRSGPDHLVAPGTEGGCVSWSGRGRLRWSSPRGLPLIHADHG